MEMPPIEPGSCNVCGVALARDPCRSPREMPTCDACGSTARFRSIVHALSLATFGRSLVLPDLPAVPGLSVLGLSVWEPIGDVLRGKFGFLDTHFEREPVLDITDPPADLDGTIDVLISSEVFEHVVPPVSRAFAGAFRLLRPGGVLVLTVPFVDGVPYREHYPDLHRFDLSERDGRTELVNETREGAIQRFADPAFHGGGGATLEMRVFDRAAVLDGLAAAGFTEVVVHERPEPRFGVCWSEPGGFPLTARRGRSALSRWGAVRGGGDSRHAEEPLTAAEVAGPIRLSEPPIGRYEDGWVGAGYVLRGVATETLTRVTIEGALPGDPASLAELAVTVNGKTSRLRLGAGKPFAWEAPIDVAAGEAVTLRVVPSNLVRPADFGGQDKRRLGVHLVRVGFA